MWMQQRLAFVAALGVCAALLVAPAASALTEQELQAQEIRTLGPEHAAEHARLRAEARLAAASTEQGPVRSAALTGGPEDIGRWLPKFATPGVALHAVMLRTGKVLYFTGTTSGRAFLLDPVAQTTRAVYPPKVPGGEDEPANIFCAGQS